MVIGLTGFQRSGKSTAAQYLFENYFFQRLNMKDELVKEMRQNFAPLLELFAEHYGLTIDQLFAEKPPMMRSLMQTYGTEVRRKQNPNYWTDKWVEAYSKLHPANVVCDDVRFMNEAEAVRSVGGKIIRLVRPDINSGGNHQSETEMLSIEADYTIEIEPGDHTKLYTELDKILG